jgi:D-3-phosphoglycerate dehydrogenase
VVSSAAVKVLVADKLSGFVAGRLGELGADVVVDPSLNGPTLTAKIAEMNPDVVVVRSTKVGKADLAAGSDLALVVRAGAGVNTIDVDTASSRGIYVTNCPGKNAVAVAELTFAHLLNCDRRVSDNVQSLRDKRWNKKEFGKALGLRGRTLAVLGCGTIGREVIARARAFGMKVVGWSWGMTPEEAEAIGIGYAPTPEAAVAGAHAVTLHVALVPETRNLIGEKVFDAMRDGAYFINTSRGEVVDQDALVRAVKTKHLRAGLDVFASEPAAAEAAFDDPIGQMPGVYGTHHIGASTDEAEDAVGEEVVRIIAAYRDGRPIPNCVNLATRTDATHMLIVRHQDQVGVLAHVLNVLREAGHNVQEMQNIVFSGTEAACARIAIVERPTDATLARVKENMFVIAVSVTPFVA